MTAKTLDEHIEITPGVTGGKARIAGHRITVLDIAIWHDRLGCSPSARGNIAIIKLTG